MKSHHLRTFIQAPDRLFATLAVIVLLPTLGGYSGKLYAQEIERPSLAGESAAEALEEENSENQPYNIQLGPMTMRLNAEISASYNDNINISKTQREDDFIVTPAVNLHGLWQVSDLNQLTFDLGIGYQAYTTHSNFDALTISPNSQTQFNIFIGDFKINLHERLSFQDNPIQVGQLSNTNQFPYFTNIAGVNVDWDLGDMVVSLGYNHINDWVFTTAYDYLDDQSDVVSPELTFRLTKTVEVGVNASLTDQRYDQHVENDSTGVAGGPFISAQLSDDLSLEGHAGWDYRSYDRGGSIADNDDTNSYYYNLGINHRFNTNLTESLVAGREFISGLTSNFTKRLYANYSLTWQATSSVSIAPDLWWENLEDSDAAFHQRANRYGAGANANYSIAEHSAVYLGYQYVLKTAEPSFLNYSQNVVTIGYRYQF